MQIFSASIGWLATGVVVASYFCKGERTLRAVQFIGAAMWMSYGIVINSAPVVAANVLVMAAAAWTARRKRAVKTGGGA
jgi:hypothetical protein